jgi:hypothetical protein
MLINLPGDVEEQLQDIASKQGRNVGTLVEEAVREYLVTVSTDNADRQARPSSKGRGPVALWDGEIHHTSIEHDSIYDQP